MVVQQTQTARAFPGCAQKKPWFRAPFGNAATASVHTYNQLPEGLTLAVTLFADRMVRSPQISALRQPGGANITPLWEYLYHNIVRWQA